VLLIIIIHKANSLARLDEDGIISFYASKKNTLGHLERFFSRSHKQRQKAVENCSTSKQARRFLAHTHTEKTLLRPVKTSPKTRN